MENNFWTDERVLDFIGSLVMNAAKRGANFKKEIEDFKKSIEVRKDYEILSFAEPIWHEVEHYTKQENGLFKNSLDKDFYIESSLIEKYPIYSVKRLSDGEVFAVGDKINDGIIEGFFIGWSGMEIHINNGCGTLLKSASKIKDYQVLYSQATESNDSKNVIKQVRRLSDGEIFTVGDKIATSASDSFCSIYGFKIHNDKLIIDCTHSYLANEKGIDLLEDMKKVKPLFRTEDGVDYYDTNKEYWIVFLEEWFGYDKYDLLKVTGNLSLANYKSDCKTFSMEEKAKEYILMNKPCISAKDLMGHWCLDAGGKESVLKLAKQKLKL